MIDPPQTPENPLDQIAARRQRVAEICDLLEALADDLPEKSNDLWREAARRCGSDIPRHYDEINRALLPLLKMRLGATPEVAALERFEADTQEDSFRASELLDLLGGAELSRTRKLDADAVGYALRGFFLAIRRQVLWERDVLLPLADRILTKADLARLAARLTPAETTSGQEPLPRRRLH